MICGKSYNLLKRELAMYASLPFYRSYNTERYLDYKMRKEALNWPDIITYVNLDLDTEHYTCVKQIKVPDHLYVLVNKHNQLNNQYVPCDLEEINPTFSLQGLRLRREARRAFEIMSRCALRDGIILTAISTYRSYDYQETVYFSKFTPEMNLEDYQNFRDKVSARPGHSEHQTGLAVDINDLEETFELTPEGKWLAAHSYRYGFILRYPKNKEHITGYSFEPWHFRYLGVDLAVEVYQSGLTYDEFYVRNLCPQ
ncbi:MAG: yodJ [Herbinix sp.]|nr:yodJ [Herbinix sp.]